MSDVLKPCAHCGNDSPIAHEMAARSEFKARDGFYVTCFHCKTGTGPYANQAAANRAWNRRTIPTIPVLGKIGDERRHSPADHSSDH